MTRRSRRRQRAALLATTGFLLAGSVVGVAGPAQASFGEPPPPSAIETAPKANVVEKSCSLYGSSNGYGMVCYSPGGGGVLDLVSLLGGNPLPRCWDDAPPPGFLPPRAQEGPGTWWLRTCVSGLDLRTLRRLGPIGLTYSFEFLRPGDEVRLTSGQARVVRFFTGSGQIPYPILRTSPTASPRVGETVTYGLFGEGRSADLVTGGVTMYAQAIGLKVDPGDGTPAVTCDGPGRLLTREQIAAGEADAPDVCDHAYERSSAGAGGSDYPDRYRTTVTAYWQIRYYSGDPANYQVLGTYAKTAVNQIRVTEVQTLVVN